MTTSYIPAPILALLQERWKNDTADMFEMFEKITSGPTTMFYRAGQGSSGLANDLTGDEVFSLLNAGVFGPHAFMRADGVIAVHRQAIHSLVDFLAEVTVARDKMIARLRTIRPLA